ncbi:MAG: aryl-sulfate sulfotransferase [Bacteroidota bacterium]
MIINTIKNWGLICLMLFSGILSFGQQQTMGVFIYDKENTADGYIFFSPNSYTDAYLIDNCGFLVNSWDRDHVPGLAGHLTPSGLMLRTGKVNGPFYSQASTGGNLELVDWDNNTVWSSDFNQFEFIQHHDAVLMPNGNVIYIGWERISPAQQIEYGRNPSEVSQPHLWGEFIQEVKPIGNSDYEVVWEWHLQDHFVQDYDPSKQNYGVVQDELGKVDINYEGPAIFSDEDWWHCNALDYNEDLDQILLNCRSNGEVWIIDHSTTTEEATGTTGGNSGKGGELLYRWGNPSSYKRGSIADLRQYGSHGHYWIPEGLPNAGKIMFFNNGDQRPQGYYSTVEMIDPIFENGEYRKNNNERYYPLEPEIAYKAPNPFDFRSTYLSNANQLSNGNVFINEGGTGRLFEVNAQGNIVWEYLNPVDGSGPNVQGENVWSFQRQIFRAYKYEPDYPAFEGKDLTSGELLEGDSEYNQCMDVSTNDENTLSDVGLTYDLGSGFLTIENISNKNLTLTVQSIDGKIHMQESINNAYHEINLNALQAGVYVISVVTSDGKKGLNKKIVRI